jgi:hypothetical protein
MMVAAEEQAPVMAEALGHHPAPPPAAHPAVLDGEWAITCPLARLQVLAVVPD